MARGASLLEAYRAAYICDPTSAFGGIVALNCTLDAATAEEICKIFTEVVIAPDATAEARVVAWDRPLLMTDVPTTAAMARAALDVAGLTERMCGATRPGHFDGVTTISPSLTVSASRPDTTGREAPADRRRRERGDGTRRRLTESRLSDRGITT